MFQTDSRVYEASAVGHQTIRATILQSLDSEMDVEGSACVSALLA